MNPIPTPTAMHRVNGGTNNLRTMTTANHAAAWSWAEDKIFENALVNFPEGVANRWQRISERLPGKSQADVMAHYQAVLYDVGQIDSGRVELPSYSDERNEHVGLTGSGRNSVGLVGGNGKRAQCERKKGRPWTIEEHRLFLHGLEIYGKSDWRSISRNVVTTRLPSQVASHAQKYFNRLKSGKKERKRSSIHDITSASDCFSVPQSSCSNNITATADCFTVPQMSSIHNVQSAMDCSNVPSSNHNIGNTVDCFSVPQRSSINDITTAADCFTVPQMSNIHNIQSAVNCSNVLQRSRIHNVDNAVDCLSVPQRSSLHDITSAVDCMTAPQRSGFHDIVSAVDCFTLPSTANPPVQECFQDFSFTM